MPCPFCGRQMNATEDRCAHCGKRNEPASGVFQTSTVLIATRSEKHLYHSVEEVPAHLLERLLKSAGANRRTILIADRRIASRGHGGSDDAFNKLSEPSRQLLSRPLLPRPESPGALDWLTPPRRKWLGICVVLAAVALVATVFLHHWK